ncbi:LysR substrate-binding domain-containing protein [Pseudophaeobacter sp.]|uniref:LysR substrate-binding domain-containing protein n=1 Tax=Pseudophaeobacter sp. TaxID=1971739 RepID=UPI0040583EC5
MPSKRKVLPPLDYLLAFESAAKACSFARASEDLNISETAISRKVRLLEQHYDVPLFVRGNRSITLTQHGTTLLASVTQSIDILREASRDIFANHQANTINLAATNSVAALWLMPRLRKFNRSNARVKISLVASDSDAECLANEMDLSILRGDGSWPGYEAQLLFGETVFPVCSPGYLARQNHAPKISELPELDLIEVTSSHAEWMTWKTWFSHQEVADPPLDRAVAFNTYPLAIQAALDGFGVVLGWGHLVDHLLASGELVRPTGEAAVRTQSGYYLLTNKSHKGFPERQIVKDWLVEQSAQRKRYG